MGKVMKKKMVNKKRAASTRIKKSTIRSALVSSIKAATGRKDINIRSASKAASTTQTSIPIEKRAGFPVKLVPGAVHPKNWKTHNGVPITVDFSRARWLPDDWGQGIKGTIANSRNTGGGGILTVYVGPDMKSYFHKEKVEEYIGKKLTEKDGWNGQVRLARLQAEQAIDVARQQIKIGDNSLTTETPDSIFFQILTNEERKNLPSKDEFHFSVISARRATNVEGVADITRVQCALDANGVKVTWYVDEASIDAYKALGLNVKKGGKLCPSRNAALEDARKMGKICVQLSDDISSWEYRHGKQATVRTDEANNAAYAKAKRYIISPVAAARFIVAKMRSCAEPKPKLGGVYMLGSCSRAFAGKAFSRHHFILGDFLVIDKGSKVNFDEEMGLKEDYEFSCAHIKAHGSVMRCNRMTLSVKHYANAGGAVTNRDGKEEQRNIAILNRKYPGCFKPNPKRKNEVIMRWKHAQGQDDDDDDDDDDDESLNKKTANKSTKKDTTVKKKTLANRPVKGKVLKKQILKSMATSKTSGGQLPRQLLEFGSHKKITVGTGQPSPYIKKRCERAVGKTVKEVLENFSFKGAKGSMMKYTAGDLRYDIMRKFIVLK